jgi:hypothetical protein
MQGRFACYNISAADTMAEETSIELVQKFYPEYVHLAEPLVGHTSFVSYQAAAHDLRYRPRHSWRENSTEHV